MASAVIRSLHLIAAVLATGVVAAQAQTAAPAASKAWVDPGAVERAKTQSAETAAPAPAAAPKAEAPKAETTKAEAPKADAPKQSASDSEKLKELIRAAETSAADKGRKPAYAHAAHHAHPAVAHHAVAHHAAVHHAAVHHAAAAPHKVAARHAAPHHVVYQDLPSKKDGPVAPSGDVVRAAY
jgi:hypothetical protein